MNTKNQLLMKTLGSLLGCFILSIVCCKAQELDYSFREKYTVSLPAQISIASFDGNIEVIPSANEQIQVYYIVKRNNKLLNISRKELEQELIVEVFAENNSLKIKVE